LGRLSSRLALPSGGSWQLCLYPGLLAPLAPGLGLCRRGLGLLCSACRLFRSFFPSGSSRSSDQKVFLLCTRLDPLLHPSWRRPAPSPRVRWVLRIAVFRWDLAPSAACSLCRFGSDIEAFKLFSQFSALLAQRTVHIIAKREEPVDAHCGNIQTTSWHQISPWMVCHNIPIMQAFTEG
jgi:hypothetical protein